jgi:hypothetical protein
MKILHLSIIAILSIVILININSAFAAELGQLYLPPASLGNRTANLFIDITPSDVEKSAKYIHLRLFDQNNNQTFQHVTFLLNITKQNQTLLKETFHSHSGLLAIKLISNDTVGNWTVFGEPDPLLGWMPKDGKLEINSSLQKGLYHFEITIVTIDNDKSIFLLQDAPKFDSWWTVDDNNNIFRNDQLNQNNLPFTILESPLKQFKSGIAANDVKCKEGLQLVIKGNDDSPACVKLDTAQKLVERGWGSNADIPISLPYPIGNNGTLSGVVSAYVYGGPLTTLSPNRSVHYEVDVYATDGVTIVGRTLSDANAHYSIQLSAGNYIIYTYNDTKQTHLVSVYTGKNTVFNISSSISVP